MNATHWLTATALALALGASHLLDGPDEVQAAQDAAQDANEAPLQARQQARGERIAEAHP